MTEQRHNDNAVALAGLYLIRKKWALTPGPVIPGRLQQGLAALRFFSGKKGNREFASELNDMSNYAA